MYVTRDYATTETADLFDCVYVTRDYATMKTVNLFDCVYVTRDYATMDAADLSLGGTLLLSDCDNMDKIPDVSRSRFHKQARVVLLVSFLFP